MLNAFNEIIWRVLRNASHETGGEGAATAPAGCAGDTYVEPEGETPIEEDELEKMMREARDKRQGLDKDLERVESALDLVGVRDFLAKKYGMKSRDVTTRWNELHKAPDDVEPVKPLAPFQKDVKPAEKPQDLKAVVLELVDVYKRFIVFKDEKHQPFALALWTLATWFENYVNFAPYVLVTAPEKRCGKSQLLGLMAKLSKKPLEAGSMSAAVLFRVTEKYHPTIFIDEVDSFLERDEDLKGMIKCGIERGKALAWRMEKNANQQLEPMSYDCFAFKALSGIDAKNISDTITDRCITIELMRKLTAQVMPKVRDEKEELWTALNEKCARLALDYGEKLRNYRRPEMPKDLSDRDADKWRPLIALADLIDGDEGMKGPLGKLGAYGHFARATAVILSRDVDADEPQKIALLRNIREVLNDESMTAGQRIEYILSALLTERLNANDEWQWQEMRGGKGLTATKLAGLLRTFGVKPEKVRQENNKSGYMTKDFEDPFYHYLGDAGEVQMTNVDGDTVPV